MRHASAEKSIEALKTYVIGSNWPKPIFVLEGARMEATLLGDTEVFSKRSDLNAFGTPIVIYSLLRTF